MTNNEMASLIVCFPRNNKTTAQIDTNSIITKPHAWPTEVPPMDNKHWKLFRLDHHIFIALLFRNIAVQHLVDARFAFEVWFKLFDRVCEYIRCCNDIDDGTIQLDAPGIQDKDVRLAYDVAWLLLGYQIKSKEAITMAAKVISDPIFERSSLHYWITKNYGKQRKTSKGTRSPKKPRPKKV